MVYQAPTFVKDENSLFYQKYKFYLKAFSVKFNVEMQSVIGMCYCDILPRSKRVMVGYVIYSTWKTVWLENNKTIIVNDCLNQVINTSRVFN